MMSFIPPKARAIRRNVFYLLFFSTASVSLLIQPVHGQQQSLSEPSGMESAQWIVGPSTTYLGNTAEISIPAGCRFTDAAGARLMLQRSTNPVPENVVGLLVSQNPQWFAVIQFAEVGYVKDAGKDKLDADALLKILRTDIKKQIQARAPAGSAVVVPEVSWEIKPVYDPVQGKLEYGLKAQGPAGGSINYSASWLGRHGELMITAVLPASAGFDLAALRQAMQGVTFKYGERYADYQAGDRIARYGLAELITHSDGAEPPTRLQLLARNKWVWGGGAAALLLVGISGYGLTVFLKKRRTIRYYGMDQPRPRPAQATSATVAVNGHTTNGNGTSKPVVANGQRVISENDGFRRNGHRRRKKRFSYHAFYSDMVMNLTRCNYGGSPGPLIKNRSDDSTPGISPSQQAELFSTASSDTAKLLVAEASKLIQSQQMLIEGQRKLIEEQSKLIHEKSLLLDAESRALGKQLELIEEQQLT